MQHQAQGLQRLFAGHAARIVSVVAGPSVPDSNGFILALAAELSRESLRVWLVETVAGVISPKLGCRPLLSWQAGQPLEQQVIRAGHYGLIHAPGCMAGDAALSAAARQSRGCDFLLFDGGHFTQDVAPLDPASAQTVIVLLGSLDAEAGYALVKALITAQPAGRILLLGEVAGLVAQSVLHFMGRGVESRQTEDGLCQIDNRTPETSSNTLTIAPNLAWVVSRITQNDQPKVAHGGSGKGAEEVYKR